MEATEATPDSLIGNLDSSKFTKFLIDRMETVAWNRKRTFAKKNGINHADGREMAETFIRKVHGMLKRLYLNVDHSSPKRDLALTDWSKVTSFHRSSLGSTGIFFIQSDSEENPTIIVAKPLSDVKLFETLEIANEMATIFFGIKCPKSRLVKGGEEFGCIENALKNLMDPDTYENGDDLTSPKKLFMGPCFMLIEYVADAKVLCSFREGQRELTIVDFEALGKLFLFDLLIDNWDRFPNRKVSNTPFCNTLLFPNIWCTGVSKRR